VQEQYTAVQEYRKCNKAAYSALSCAQMFTSEPNTVATTPSFAVPLCFAS
jgi:hypothetical protein